MFNINVKDHISKVPQILIVLQLKRDLFHLHWKKEKDRQPKKHKQVDTAMSFA